MATKPSDPLLDGLELRENAPRSLDELLEERPKARPRSRPRRAPAPKPQASAKQTGTKKNGLFCLNYACDNNGDNSHSGLEFCPKCGHRLLLRTKEGAAAERLRLKDDSQKKDRTVGN